MGKENKLTLKQIALTITLILILSVSEIAGQVKSYCFAQRDTTSLWMDVYQPTETTRKDICVLYIFGGGFVKGSKTKKDNVDFFHYLVEKGYTVVAIEYRLGLKGVKKVGPFHPQPLFNAIRMATEDLISATSFIVKNQQELRIDPNRIALVGSSAGAITALIGDYEVSNRSAATTELPSDFRYAAVVSFAGGIFSSNGTPRYATPPAPTLFLHGTKDKIVVYKKIRVFKNGLFGTDALVNIFKKNSYPFIAIRYEGAKHEVAGFYRENLPLLPEYGVRNLVCDFIDGCVAKTFNNEIDLLIQDQNLEKKRIRK